MKDKDIVTREYMTSKVRFADLFNYYLYGGQAVIKPEELIEQDVVKTIRIPLDDGTSQTQNRFRDLLKRSVIHSSGKAVYLLLGLENQSEIEYTLPVRNMLYDAMDYISQIRDIREKHRKDRDLHDSASFLSGFTANDKLLPVITLCIYWGAKKWDAPRSLHEMLEADDDTLCFVNDYKVHLIVPREIKNFDLFQTELGSALELLAASSTRKSLLGKFEEKREIYDSLSEDTIQLLEVCTRRKIRSAEETEEEDMSVIGIYDWVEQGRKEGVERKLIAQICCKIRKQKPVETIADDLEEELASVQRIYDVAVRFAPDYDVDKIYEALQKEKVSA